MRHLHERPNMKVLAGVCVAFSLAVALADPASAQAGGKLRIAVEGAYPPFSEIATDGKIKGFDIDIANAVCARMKVECVQVQAEFDAMIPALRAKKFDAIVASMSITPERLKAVDFSRHYYDSDARIVTRADAKFEVGADGPRPAAGGKPLKLGVQRATIHDRYATDKLKGVELVRYGKQDEVFLDLVAGRIDAALADGIAIDLGFLKTPAGKGFALRGPAYIDPVYFGVGPGIAVRKGDKALVQKLDAALVAIMADGTYKSINDKYFAFDIMPAWAKTK
jgi:arginine/ornithine transport system substrate-binding protein